MQRKANPVPRLLVTGSNGQVGFELRRSLAPLGEVIALDRAGCDLTQPDALRRLVREHRPDVIVNPAAYTAVDKAETDAVDPQSVYGKSKLAGEQAIADSGAAALVLRTCWVAGAHGGNFAKTMLKLGRERDSLRVIADQFGAPTTAALIADVTAQIIARFWLSGDRAAFPGGIYHLAAAGETTWHGYATEVLCYVKSHGVDLKVDPEQIEAIPATAYPLPAPRPANSRMNTAKLTETFGIHLPDWKQGIHLLLDQILS